MINVCQSRKNMLTWSLLQWLGMFLRVYKQGVKFSVGEGGKQNRDFKTRKDINLEFLSAVGDVPGTDLKM